MGMKAVRAARKNHPMPTLKATTSRVASKYSDGQIPQSSVLRDREMGAFPNRTWPHPDTYPLTGSPPANLNTTWASKEGKTRGRQSDKSSKSK